MKKIDLGHIKTTHRFRNGVDQTIRLFNKTQKKLIINEVLTKSEDIRIEDVLNLYGVSPAVYYSWVRKHGKMNKVMSEMVSMTPQPVEIKRILVEVDITTTEDLFKMIREFCKIEGVKSVSA